MTVYTWGYNLVRNDKFYIGRSRDPFYKTLSDYCQDWYLKSLIVYSKIFKLMMLEQNSIYLHIIIIPTV